MDKEKILEEIFNNDPFGLLKVQVRYSSVRTEDERLVEKFKEIVLFYENNNHTEPTPNILDVKEYELYSRLKSLRENQDNIEK